mmetsp:Transcript_17011/g.51001  ORF Transcript_17011/g.51001 Transcript_17011/m.51001 type:complete len:221 (+) Transcript_17011:557-1219(+)
MAHSASQTLASPLISTRSDRSAALARSITWLPRCSSARPSTAPWRTSTTAHSCTRQRSTYGPLVCSRTSCSPARRRLHRAAASTSTPTPCCTTSFPSRSPCRSQQRRSSGERSRRTHASAPSRRRCSSAHGLHRTWTPPRWSCCSAARAAAAATAAARPRRSPAPAATAAAAAATAAPQASAAASQATGAVLAEAAVSLATAAQTRCTMRCSGASIGSGG